MVSQDTGVLNDYGINTEDNEITLTFLNEDEYGNAMSWNESSIKKVVAWFISDEFKPFVSYDNLDITYFLKGKSYKKRFANNMKGLIDVTFETYSQYGYKRNNTALDSYNQSKTIYIDTNIQKAYKPKVIIKNINANSVSISNLTTGNDAFTINNLTNNQIITIDNEIGTVMCDQENLIMHSNRKWLELIPGNNKITVSGNCNVEIMSLYPVMV